MHSQRLGVHQQRSWTQLPWGQRLKKKTTSEYSLYYDTTPLDHLIYDLSGKIYVVLVPNFIRLMHGYDKDVYISGSLSKSLWKFFLVNSPVHRPCLTWRHLRQAVFFSCFVLRKQTQKVELFFVVALYVHSGIPLNWDFRCLENVINKIKTVTIWSKAAN